MEKDIQMRLENASSYDKDAEMIRYLYEQNKRLQNELIEKGVENICLREDVKRLKENKSYCEFCTDDGCSVCIVYEDAPHQYE